METFKKNWNSMKKLRKLNENWKIILINFQLNFEQTLRKLCINLKKFRKLYYNSELENLKSVIKIWENFNDLYLKLKQWG